MSFKDAIKKSVLDGFVSESITTEQIIVVLLITVLLGIYIFMAYRLLTENSFYDRSFNISIAAISVVTAGIILAMQSNLVISLGMVGALSIVRFRTAIKEPMDLLFLFWSISIGIICGAGLFKLAIIVSVVVTLCIIILKRIPSMSSPYLLVINLKNKEFEKNVIETIKSMTKSYRVDSKSITNAGVDMIIEIKSKEASELTDKLSSINGVTNVSLLFHDGVVKS